MSKTFITTINEEDTKVLSHEETVRLLKKYRYEGDESAKEALIKSNIKYVIKEVYKYKKDKMLLNGRFELEDLFQIGIIGLIKGIDTYDMNRLEEIKLITYASVSIENSIYTFIRGFYAYKRGGEAVEVKLDKHIDLDDDDKTTIYNLIPSKTNIEREVENSEMYRILMENIDDILNEKEKQIILNRFDFDKDKPPLKQKELAKEMNLPNGCNVSRMENKALKKLRKFFEQIGVEV